MNSLHSVERNTWYFLWLYLRICRNGLFFTLGGFCSLASPLKKRKKRLVLNLEQCNGDLTINAVINRIKSNLQQGQTKPYKVFPISLWSNSQTSQPFQRSNLKPFTPNLLILFYSVISRKVSVKLENLDIFQFQDESHCSQQLTESYEQSTDKGVLIAINPIRWMKKTKLVFSFVTLIFF